MVTHHFTTRGPLGDCRDPFYVTGNSTTLEHKSHGVKTIPCASGWCSKVLEDVDEVTSHEENYGSATQRDCLQRAPSDGQQRCAFVKLNHKQVYMCFCQGDLCNSGDSLRIWSVPIILLFVTVSFLLWYYYKIYT